MQARSLGEQLSACGWKSGSVIGPELYAAVAPHLHHSDREAPAGVDPHDWLIVASQSCDVVAHNDDAEPYVELLCAHPLGQKPRAQFRDLHSTRWLDFRPNRQAHPETVLSAHATADRYFVPRMVLSGSKPSTDRTLSAVAVRRLQEWLALRASRPAWPDNFVHRIDPVRRQLEKALKPLHEDIAEVRVAISPKDRELDASDGYRVAIFFIVPAEIYEAVPERRREVQACFDAFMAAIRKCVGVEVDTDLSDVIPGDKFTWQETQSSDLWDFANLSPLE